MSKKQPKKNNIAFPPLEQRWFTIAEAAVYARRSELTIRNWIHDGLLRASKPDSGYLVDRHTLDEFLIRHERMVAPYRRGTRPAVAARHAHI